MLFVVAGYHWAIWRWKHETSYTYFLRTPLFYRIYPRHICCFILNGYFCTQKGLRSIPALLHLLLHYFCTRFINQWYINLFYISNSNGNYHQDLYRIYTASQSPDIKVADDRMEDMVNKIFSRVHATQQVTVSVCRSVGLSRFTFFAYLSSLRVDECRFKYFMSVRQQFGTFFLIFCLIWSDFL